MTNLENLSKEEREAVIKILQEMSSSGSSEKMNELLLADYEEIPVDIYTFLHDKTYLGNGLTDADGRYTLFPYWEDLFKRMYPDPLKPSTCNTLALSGGIGLGKTLAMTITGCYELYRMLCLRDPYAFYGIQPIDVISFALINITLDAAKGVAWSKMQNLIQSSPWFMARGTVNKSATFPEWSPPKGIELLYGSKPSHIIGRALFWCGQDEVSFRQNMDVEKQKEAASELVNSAAARMQSRFMKGEYNPTLLVLASSKRTEQSFLETWIENKKKNESKTTIVVDEPQWVIRTDKDSPKKFKVAIGNKFLPSEVVPLDATEDEINALRDRGYRLLDVPMGYYENFLDDIDIALTDIAGVSTTSLSSYISGERIANCKFEGENPFTKDIIAVGNGKDDTTQYSDFFDLAKVPVEMKSKPLFIHLDMSISGDKTGIAGVWIKGKKPPKEGQPETKDLLFQLAFCISIKAPRGHQVSFEKTRIFINWLKENNFCIKYISMDTFQSADMLQYLKDNHFNAGILSVDRVNSDRICLPYQYLKSTIYEERIMIPRRGTNLLTEELIGLKRNNNSGKVDHTPDGINSKDSADALCGALYDASLNAAEYSYEYGENLASLVELNKQELNYNDSFEAVMKENHKNIKETSTFRPDIIGDEWFGADDGVLMW